MSLHSLTQLRRTQLHLKNQTGMNFLSCTSSFVFDSTTRQSLQKLVETQSIKNKNGQKDQESRLP